LRDPFIDVRHALDDHSAVPDASGVTVDPGRRSRTGIPEVVFGESKPDDVLVAACAGLLRFEQRVVVSRIALDRAYGIARKIGDLDVEQPFPGQTVVLARAGSAPPPLCGAVVIFTAGSSDIPIAGEAATVASETGCDVKLVTDVGVAGLHRLVQPLRRAIASGADVIVVVAGMDGALPSVVTGLVDVPVIGLPTSVGYGVAAGGHAALNTMLSSCAPGMAVVNIDNGVGAGAMAARIARRARQERT
jgi:NCAIR mutase (PurE)-related protein